MKRKLSRKSKLYFLKQFTASLLSIVMLFGISCSDQEVIKDTEVDSLPQTKIECFNKFAEVLSTVVSKREDVRLFLKQEALKQFDKNYDVLYVSIEDKYIGEDTFRDILVAESSEKIIQSIENNIPRLNIYIPKIPFLRVYPEELDIKDKELPVVLSKKDKTSLFVNGKKEIEIEKGQIPDFHTLVVNENRRVVVNRKELGFKSASTKRFEFISPVFDGTKEKQNNLKQKSVSTNKSIVGKKAFDAFKYFYKDEVGIEAKYLQRDYIYYGLTQTNTTGKLDRGVSEYIKFIEIDPKAFYSLSDQYVDNGTFGDPHIKEDYVTNKKYTLTEEELIERMWSSGVFDFRFEVYSAGTSQVEVVHINLRPEELWNFNVEYWYRHKTWFRHSKHYYKIDPKKFTPKKVFLNQDISLGKWNLAEDGLQKYVKIYEVDIKETKTFTQEVTTKKLSKWTVTGSIKKSLGDGKEKPEIGGSVGYEKSEEETIKTLISVTRSKETRLFGAKNIFFYDPIIESSNAGKLELHTYSAGPISFGITAK